MSRLDEQFNALIRSFRTATPSGPALERALHRIGMLIVAKAKTTAPVDQGALRNSLSYSVEMDPNGGGSVVVGSYGVPYAAMQEFGGTIRPRRARALTVPVAPWAKYRRARDFKLVLIRKSGRRDGGILVDPRKIPKGSTQIPRNAIGFALRSSVKLRGRYYLRNAVDSTSDKIVTILRDLGNAI